MMSSKKSAAYVCAMVGIVFAVGGGCMGGEEVGDEEETVEGAEPESEETYTVQVVDLDQGGVVVYEGQITGAQQRLARDAELKGEFGQAADAIAKADPCFSLTETVLKIWDQTNYTGNQICFSGTGLADLNSYCRFMTLNGCVLWWGGGVTSFKTGTYDARFGDISSGSGSYPNALCCDWSCDARDEFTDVSAASVCEQDQDTNLVDRGTVTCDPGCF